MFDFLKKKIGAFFTKEELVEKPSKAVIKKSKKIKQKTEKKKVISKKTQKEVKIIEKTKELPKISNEDKKELQKVEEKSFFQKAKSFFTPKKTEELTKIEEKEKPEEEKEESPSEVEKEIKEKPIEEIKEEGFFSKLIKKISHSELTQEQFDELFQEFEITLLENNVALDAVDKIKETLGKELVGKEIKKDANNKVLDALKNSILSILIEPPDLIEQIKKQKIFTILFFGINGTGKTTSIAKLAHLLKKNKMSCVLAAADTFRAASIEQLKIHGEKIGVPVIASQYGSDPASVAFEAKKYAQTHNVQVVLIDTAGRMYTKENLLKEMEKIVRISQPDLKIFVGESITGNDTVDQAKTFNETIGLDGIILSKADVDEKAGAILSVSQVTGKPIYFLGTGQNYEDLAVFTKKLVLKNLGLE